MSKGTGAKIWDGFNWLAIVGTFGAVAGYHYRDHLPFKADDVKGVMETVIQPKDTTPPLNAKGHFNTETDFEITAPDKISLTLKEHDVTLHFRVEGDGKLKLFEAENYINVPNDLRIVYADPGVLARLYKTACEHAQTLAALELPPESSKYVQDYRREKLNAGEFIISSCAVQAMQEELINSELLPRLKPEIQ